MSVHCLCSPTRVSPHCAPEWGSGALTAAQGWGSIRRRGRGRPRQPAFEMDHALAELLDLGGELLALVLAGLQLVLEHRAALLEGGDLRVGRPGFLDALP